MTQPFTDADVELVARALAGPYWDTAVEAYREAYRVTARTGVAALAAAGRLTPAGGETRTECEIEWTDLRSSRPGSQVRVRRYSWAPDEFDHEFARLLDPSQSPHIVPTRAFKRITSSWPDGSQWVGPWLPVPEETP